MVKLKFKVLIAIPIFTVITLIIGITSIINGIPFGNMIAKHYIKQYAEVKYNNSELKIDEISYNIENSTYCTAILGNKRNVITEMTYKWTTNSLHDSSYNGDIEKEFQANIGSLIAKSYPSIKTNFVSVWEEINANQDFSKQNLKKRDMIYVWMTDEANSDSSNDSDEKFIGIVRNIFSSLEKKYNVISSQIMYKDNYGEKQLLISNAQSKLPEKELIKLIQIVPHSAPETSKVQANTLNVDSIDKFIDSVHKGLNVKFQITKITTEGDPIIQTIEYDGTIKYTYDNTKDKFAGTAAGVTTKEYLKIYKDGDLCYLFDRNGNKSIFPQ